MERWALRLLWNVLSATLGVIGGIFSYLWEVAFPPKPKQGVVTKAVDGDSLLVKTEGHLTEVRIRGIDAPEFGQEGFQEARRRLEELTKGEEVSLIDSEKDKYGRTVATLEVQNSLSNIPSTSSDPAETLASEGLVYASDYDTDPEIKDASEKARRAKRGIWKRKGQTPWEFREKHPHIEM